MKLSEREKTYLQKVLSEEAEPNFGGIITIINKKRSDEEQLSVDDILEAATAMAELQHVDENESESPQEAVLTPEITAPDEKSSQMEKRLQELRKARSTEKDVELFIGKVILALDEATPIIKQIIEPRRPTNYMIVSGKTQAYLAQEVNKYIKMGWVPFGSVGAAAFGISPVAGNQYIQAMVLYY